MFPYGEINWNDENSKKYTLDNVATLLKAAIKAVKASSPNTKIINSGRRYCLENMV